MSTLLRVIAVLVVVAVVAGAAAFGWIRSHGLSARTKPGAMEQMLARRVRSMAMPAGTNDLRNPVEPTPVVIREALEHYADHCAVCHANNGSGDTDTGKGLYPRAPDMRLPATQQLRDGELFYIIENGTRFTGMPAWATGTQEGETASWKLVHFIRHLPKLLPEELGDMESFNPRSADQVRQQLQEEERSLEAGQPPPSPSSAAHHH